MGGDTSELPIPSRPAPMKTIPIAVSLFGNVALAATLALRPALAPDSVRGFIERYDPFAPKAVEFPAPKPIAPSPPSKLWDDLRTDDLRTLVARLRARGFPLSIIRSIIDSLVNARYQARFRALTETDPSTPFWKLRPKWFMPGDKRLVELNRLQRERTKFLHDVLGEDIADEETSTANQLRRFGNLSRAKIQSLQGIEDDYSEMTGAVQAGANGILLPEDRDQLALLAREKHADIAAVLSPDELADYEMRSSPITNFVRNRLGDFDASEDEFRVIFQAQQAVDDKFPGGAMGGNIDNTLRLQVQQEFNDQIRAGLGDARYAEYVRDWDPVFNQLNQQASANSLADGAALQAYSLRDAVAQQSSQIFNDNTLSRDQKSADLQALAQNTRDQITSILGPTVGAAYLRSANAWLNQVANGSAVTFPTGVGLTIISPGGTITYGSSPTYQRLPGLRRGP